jgi:cephalosporin hydroxylase
VRRILLYLVACLLLFSAGGAAGVGVYRAVNPPAPPEPTSTNRRPINVHSVLKRFHQIWYYDKDTWKKNCWLGIVTEQNPMDSWILQEIMFDTKPDYVVECGSLYGGSAALWATILAQVNPSGRVISIDIEDRMGDARKLPIVKERVDFLIGSSTAPEIVSEVARRVQGKRVLVILDSLHTKEHVLDELHAYSPMLSVGDYINVQDTNWGGLPLGSGEDSNPHQAVEAFLKGNSSFEIDHSRERLLFTVCPDGYLKRIK